MSVKADIRYKTSFTGLEDSDLSDLVKQVSQLKTLEDRPPASAEALRHRADDDLTRLQDAAHSIGYWDAQFAVEVDTTAEPATVTVSAKPGPVYHVSEISVQDKAGKPLTIPLLREDAEWPLKPGSPAATAPVVGMESALLAALGHQGHPFAKAADRRVVVDHGTQTMRVTYRIDPGPVMRFGPASINGLSRLDPAYVERRFRWQHGMIYDNEAVDDTRKALIDSGLFSTVGITPEPDPDHPGQVRMKIDATERAHRTIGAGVAYNTSEGAGARVFWENRNLFGNAESVNVALAVGQQRNGGVVNFRRPDIFSLPDVDFLAQAEVADDTPVAYHSRHARLSLGVERRFSRSLIAGLSMSADKANVVELANSSLITAGQRTQHYALIGLPIYAKYDRSDDLLNPTRGFRVQANTAPYKSFSGRDLTFISNRVAGSVYQRLASSDRYIIAASAALSSVEGASLAQLPADKRIYAGGGGSIRAYGYQMAGQLDANKKPIGGRSALELSLEARIKITDTIGVVPFVDAGGFYPGSLPDLSRRLLFGPGLGLRYYTSFGPVRLDVATPLNRRRGDSLVQLYISLGQAF